MKSRWCGWIGIGMLFAVMGCSDTGGEQYESKREMDRISYRNTALQRQVDDQTDRIAKLQSDLKASKKQVEELQAKLADSSRNASTTLPATMPGMP